MNKKLFTKKIILELRKRNLLKESEQGDSNAITTSLQECIGMIKDLPLELKTLLESTIDEEDINLLNRTIKTLEYINKSLNEIITKHTAGLTEDIDNKPHVNMTVDNVIDKPDTLKKLTDKNIDVDVTDEQGKSLSESSEVEKNELDEVDNLGLTESILREAKIDFQQKLSRAIPPVKGLKGVYWEDDNGLTYDHLIEKESAETARDSKKYDKIAKEIFGKTYKQLNIDTNAQNTVIKKYRELNGIK